MCPHFSQSFHSRFLFSISFAKADCWSFVVTELSLLQSTELQDRLVIFPEMYATFEENDDTSNTSESVEKVGLISHSESSLYLDLTSSLAVSITIVPHKILLFSNTEIYVPWVSSSVSFADVVYVTLRSTEDSSEFSEKFDFSEQLELFLPPSSLTNGNSEQVPERGLYTSF